MCEINPKHSAYFVLEVFTAVPMEHEAFLNEILNKLIATEMRLNSDTKFRFHIQERTE